MLDKQRKKAQKKINLHVRAFNKILVNDSLWRGRFYIHQIDANWEKFKDGSGGELRVWLEIRDKKTGLYQGFMITNYGTWRLFEISNKFIVEYSGVWDNIQEVKDDKTDWNKVEWISKKEIY